MEGHPITPGQTYTWSGTNAGAHHDVIYYGPDGHKRVERDVTLPYTFVGQEGETHAVPVLRVGDVEGVAFYIDEA